MEERLLQLLNTKWGYKGFRDPQLHVIKSALAGNDNLVVMSTGGGKSICYQLPALYSNKVCIVVSPLISLMQDQVHALNARGISATFLGSAQTSNKVKQDAWQGQFQLLYVTPELLVNSTDLLQQLHSCCGIGLVAIDEAHCVSEWGHDFRRSYRQLGLVRQALPDVPIMALTATATPRVQQDIVDQLSLGRGKELHRWVMGFGRTNLHLSVQMKGATAGACLRPLIAEARQQHAAGRRLAATLVYVQSTKQADELHQLLEAAGISAAKYHSKMAAGARSDAHQAFQRDDAEVMVATVAFGMGIDKPNIRCIIHYGIASSLEAYYQQAGRAGRDGLPSSCLLLWAAKDFQLLDMLNDMDSQEPTPHQEEHRAGMMTFVNSSSCRHAQLVNHFCPGAANPQGPCAGGCDACDRRSSGVEQHRDVSQEAALLVAAVKGLKGAYGLGRPVGLLRGSKAKDVLPWMRELRGPGSLGLYGAGSKRSEAWWKGLAALLQGKDLLRSVYKRGDRGQAGYSVITATPAGLDFLNSYTRRAYHQQQQGAASSGVSSGTAAAGAGCLQLVLPPEMEAEDAEARRQQAAAAKREAERAAAAQKLGEEAAEKQELLQALRVARKQVADAVGQAPDVLVNEATLAALAEARPADDGHLRCISGMGEAACKHYGSTLLQVISNFCANAKHLKHGSNWRQGSRTSSSGGGSKLGPSAAALVKAPAAAVNQGLLQRFVAARLLSEPKGAALEAHQRWAGGETPQQIAEQRAKPIQVSTVLGYLAEAAAQGYGTAQLPLLQQQAGLGGGQQPAAQELLVAVQRVIAAEGSQGLTAVKQRLPEGASYGHIKVVAAMMVAGMLPTTPLPARPEPAPPSPLPTTPTRPVYHTPATEKLLSQPSDAALQMFQLWCQGTPLLEVGVAVHGVELPRNSVLGYLADVLGAGYEGDASLLAVDADLNQATAHQVAAWVSAHGSSGMHAVLSAAPHGYPISRIKVVTALMVTRSLWFSDSGQSPQQQQQRSGPGPAGNALTQQQQEQDPDGLDLPDITNMPGRLTAPSAASAAPVAAAAAGGGGQARLGLTSSCDGSAGKAAAGQQLLTPPSLMGWRQRRSSVSTTTAWQQAQQQQVGTSPVDGPAGGSSTTAGPASLPRPLQSCQQQPPAAAYRPQVGQQQELLLCQHSWGGQQAMPVQQDAAGLASPSGLQQQPNASSSSPKQQPAAGLQAQNWQGTASDNHQQTEAQQGESSEQPDLAAAVGASSIVRRRTAPLSLLGGAKRSKMS